MNQKLLDHLSVITGEERRLLRGNHLNQTLYTDQMDFVIDSKKMLGGGRLIALRPHTRFVDFPRHRHNYIEIMYICQGSVTHIIGQDQRVTLKQGELLFLSREAFHEIHKAGQEDIAVNFIVLPQFFDTAYDMMEQDNVLSRFIASSLCDGGEDINYLHFKVADILPVQNLIENLIWSIVYRQPNRRKLNQTTMGLLFLQLLGHTDRIQLYDRPGLEYAHKLVIEVLKEIEENYKEASLTRLSHKLGLSVSALSKQVSEATGRSYKQLLLDKRLCRAAQLLTTTTLSVADIATYVGYSNTSYFHRKFLAKYAMSPASYRGYYSGK